MPCPSEIVTGLSIVMILDRSRDFWGVLDCGSRTCNPDWGPAHGNTHGGRSADSRERATLREGIPTARVGMPDGSGARCVNSILVHSGLSVEPQLGSLYPAVLVAPRVSSLS